MNRIIDEPRIARSLQEGDIRALIRPDHVHRRAYADPEIFELEQERIFGRLWIYVAHESQLKKPGDFVRTRLGRYEVLVTRHHDGQIYVLHNRCPHRGARLCMVEGGSSRSFSCPYHAWVFRPDGSLASVPHPKSYPANFDIADPQNHMQRVGNIQSYRGFVFANLSDNPSPLPRSSRLDDRGDRQPDRSRSRRRGGDCGIRASRSNIAATGSFIWKMPPTSFIRRFVHSSSVMPARRAPANASIGSINDQTREMLMANGLGYQEWEGIQLNGTSRWPHLHGQYL